MSTPQGGHLDEGTIHAWLDGALGAAESAAVRDHVSMCATCASAVAEARGLIAGASRIVSSLDDAVVTPKVVALTTGAQATRTAAGSVWRLLRVTPSRAAIAATLLVAVGVFATRKELARENVVTQARSAVPALAPRESSSQPAVEAVSTPPTPSPLARDPLLDSAIRRRLAVSQPPRAVAKAPGVDIPQPAPQPTVREEVQRVASASTANAASTADAAVAGGRAKAAQVRDSASGLAPDLAPDLARTATLRNSNPRIQLRGVEAAAPSASPSTLGAMRAAAPSGLSGDWKGESTCQVRVTICEDEPVVLHVIGAPSGYQMLMNRLRGTVEEYSALLECVLTAEGMECRTELGVWRFVVSGKEMTGRFMGKDGVVVRVVRVVRE